MISANYDRWPVVRVTVSTSGSDEQSQARLRAFHVEVRTRGAACVLIFDLQDHEELSAERREMIKDTLLMLDARDFIVACALVCNGLQGNSNLSRKFWARPPSYPLRIFPFLHEVDEWVSMLTSDHHPAPANEGETLERAPLTREEEYVHDPLRTVGRLQFDDDLMRDPGEGAWIIHFDASCNRDMAAQMVGALRQTDLEAFLCERRLSDDLSLWLGWTGPFEHRDEAFAAREDLAKHGVQLTVSQWTASSA